MNIERKTGAVVRVVVVPTAIYSLDCVKKAAYRLLDKAAPEFTLRGDEIVCTFTYRAGVTEVTADESVRDFKSELLDQDLRQKIADETAPLRNAVLALAFAPLKPEERE